MKINKKVNKSSKKKYSMKKNAETLQLSTMALPGIILTIIFCYLPMLGVVIAFKDFNPVQGVLGSPWVGFKNFEFFFKSNDFFRLMRNTIGYSVWFLFIENFMAIVLAVLFYNVSSKWKLKYYQTTAILPHFISMVLASYIVFMFLNPESGVLNRILESIGMCGINWYSETKYWPVILTIVQIWKHIGMNSLLYYATMVGIDNTLFEAAEIDGAGKWRQTIHIIVPEIGALICLNLIRGAGHLIGGDFGLFYQIPRNIGVLYPVTDVINTYVFRATRTGNNFGGTAAVGLFASVIGTILLIITNTVVKKIDEDKSMF